jgi:hypothetical protein
MKFAWKLLQKNMTERALNNTTAAGFSSDMTREEMKAALKLARKKAKEFHKE